MRTRALALPGGVDDSLPGAKPSSGTDALESDYERLGLHGDSVASAAPLDALIASLREGRFKNGLRCPRCGGDRLQRWGRFSGRQRHRCNGCARTFSDFTGTPAAYTKKLEVWPGYARCMAGGLSVRRSAREAGVAASTAFRWRHVILDILRASDTERLSGWIELHTVSLAYSTKGRRPGAREHDTQRGAYSLGGRPRNVNVVVACDRGGHVITAAFPTTIPRRTNSWELEKLLTQRIEGSSILTAEHGPYGPAGIVAHRIGFPFREARRADARPGVSFANVRIAREYAFRFEDWLARFRGVATRYLRNYLIWHRVVDMPLRHGFARAALRWPVRDNFG